MAPSTADLLVAVLEILDDSNLPWMTARTLCTRLASRVPPVHIAAQDLEQSLIDHSMQVHRKIRYSRFPSKRTLAMLWASIERVKERSDLPDVTRFDRREIEECRVPEDAPWCFISHNFRDLEDAMGIREAIIEENLGAWIFEAEIPEGARIIEEVHRGLSESQFFLALVSRNSIGSLWVQKEIQEAHRQEVEPLYIVSAKDRQLMGMMEAWRVDENDFRARQNDLINSSCDHRGRTGIPVWTNRCVAFLHEMLEKVAHRGAVAYPQPPASWAHPTFRLQTLKEGLRELVREGQVDPGGP